MGLADEEPSGAITMRAVAWPSGSAARWPCTPTSPTKTGLDDLTRRRGVTGGLRSPPATDGVQLLNGLGQQWRGSDAARPLGRPPRLTAARTRSPRPSPLRDRAGRTDLLDLDASTRMGFINTVLGHVFGSGLCAPRGAHHARRHASFSTRTLNNAVAPDLDE